MRSLGRIIRSYLVSAVGVILIVLFLNFGVFTYVSYQSYMGDNGRLSNRKYLLAIEEELFQGGEDCRMTEKGYEILEESSFVWAMVLDENGQRIWGWQVPDELPQSYSRRDIALLTRWFLMDYPVRVWAHGEKLLLLGNARDSTGKFFVEMSAKNMRAIPEYLLLFLLVNLSLVMVLCFVFGYRLYRSLQPIAQGIEELSQKKSLHLPERGVAGELAGKLNQVSKILEYQDKKLEQRDDARTSWIAGVSHDIRTPLALILGYSDTLAGEASLGEELQAQASAIRQQSLKIRQLIEDLNLTSKLEYHAQPLRKTKFYPANLLRECVAEYYNEGLEEMYEIILSIPGEVENHSLDGDVALLKRALSNLIGNSIRHNPKGCEITIALKPRGERLLWSFRDSGKGIPAGVVETLSGDGISQSEIHIMGLRIVRQIVEAHGGELRFREKEKGGYYPEILL